MAEVEEQGASLGASTDRVEQLVYVSNSRLPISSALEMSDILARSRPNNARDGITGVLTATSGRFVQIIEGAPAAIDDLLLRLRNDVRHTDLNVLERRPAASRVFGDWDMVSPRLAADELALLELLLDEPDVGLDDIIPTLERAVASQAAMLEGRRAALDGPDASAATAMRTAAPRIGS